MIQESKFLRKCSFGNLIIPLSIAFWDCSTKPSISDSRYFLWPVTIGLNNIMLKCLGTYKSELAHFHVLGVPVYLVVND